jgi:hypothetical protein
MFTLLSSETVPLSPQVVAEFMQLEASPTERPLNPLRVAYLQKAAEEDRLINFNWSRAQCGNRMLRVNGQHSGTMLEGLNGKFPSKLYVHLDTYQVEDINDLALLFRQFDARQSGRTPKDVAGAYMGLVDILHDVPLEAGKLAVDGCAWYRKQVENLPTGAGDDKYRLFHQPTLHEFIRWIGGLLNGKTPELRADAVIGAMHGTFNKNRLEAITFWQQVSRGGADYDEQAPSTVLDKWLNEHYEAKPKILKPPHLYQGCVYAWNAFRRQRTIETIRYDTSKDWLKIAE